RYVEQRRIIGTRALRRADPDALGPVVAALGSYAVAHPLIFVRIDVKLGTEGVRVEIPLGAGIDDIPLGSGEWASIERAFDDVGIEKGSQILEQPANAGDQGIVAA